MTSIPTPQYWQVLEEATEDAQRRGHAHVGVEHLLFVISGLRNYPGDLLRSVGRGDFVRQALGELMSRPDYASMGSSNEVVDQDGQLIGYLDAEQGWVPIGTARDADKAGPAALDTKQPE